MSNTIYETLRSKLAGKPAVTKVVSLGLGSFSEKTKHQSRRLKQLALLVAIVENLNQTAGPDIEVYAQDPSFTKLDVAFLQGLGIRVLKTPSPSDLGEALRVIDEHALVYSPFLTIDAYELLMSRVADMGLLIGDDFNALRVKWEKGTPEHRQVEQLIRSRVSGFRRRALGGDDFWEEGDRAFPMAVYWKQTPAAGLVRARL
jgi:hypothetical protein